MGVGRTGQMLPGLTWVIVLIESSGSDRRPRRGPCFCCRGTWMVDGLPSGALAVEAQRWWPALWAATDGHAATPSLSLVTRCVDPFSGRRRKDSRFFSLIPSPELKKISC